MHKTMMSTDRLCEMKDRIMRDLESHYDSCSTQECGEVVDMVKDLCEAEKALWEACYYKKEIQEMESQGDDGDDRMGYDPWRYSSGRYAPKGRGHRTSVSRGRMGFDPDVMADVRTPGTYYPDHQQWINEWNNAHHPIDDYKMAKKHYTETHDDADKKAMKQHGMNHVDETVVTLKEIWNDADPELRAHLKEAVSKMVTDFK